jgi:hypothetical protein
MKAYESTKRKYTARSIKTIYKFQDVHMVGLFKNLKVTLPGFTVDELRYLSGVMGTFPIKRRNHRR